MDLTGKVKADQSAGAEQLQGILHSPPSSGSTTSQPATPWRGTQMLQSPPPPTLPTANTSSNSSVTYPTYKPATYIRGATEEMVADVKALLDKINPKKVPLFDLQNTCVGVVFTKFILDEFNEHEPDDNVFPKLCHSDALSNEETQLSAALLASCTQGIFDFLKNISEDVKYDVIRRKLVKKTQNGRDAMKRGDQKFEKFKSQLFKQGMDLNLW